MLLSLENTPPDPRLSTLRSLVSRGRHAEAFQLARAQSRHFQASKRKPFLALRTEIALGLGRFAAALEWAGEALKGLDVRDGLARTLETSRIRALIGLGRFREAGTVIDSTPAQQDEGGVDTWLFGGHIALHSGRLKDAARMAAEACGLAVSTRQRVRFIEALLLKARVAREVGDVVSARGTIDSAERACSGLRDASVLASVLSERADFRAHSGEWRLAARDADQSGRLFARASSPHEHLSAGRRTGLLGLAQGEAAVALPAIERAADVARRGYGTTECRAEIDLLLADAQLAGRDPEGALERATAALSFFRYAQDPGGLARAHVRRSLAALSASNVPLAHREARIAASIKDAGPVALGLADLALGRVLLRKDPAAAHAPFARAAGNASLYPPLRSVAHLGVALSSGASPRSDAVLESVARLEQFGDRRILSIVRSDLRDLYGTEVAGAPGDEGCAVNSRVPDEPSVDEPAEFLPGLIGASPVVQDLAVLVRKAAPHNLPVSIYGETGAGKDQIARALHELSPRARRKFVPVNAASFSDELFESELFGHVRGAFTGAQTDRLGIVEEAKGGTLFIDEVADLSSRSQTRLLRFIENGVYRRVGENIERRSEVRIVVAANRKLEDLVVAGRFREDLMHRLQGLCLTVPPLRVRGRDIVRLARHFVQRAGSGSVRLTAESEADIAAHAWPGNVRELAQEMTRAVVLADSPRIEWRRPKPPSVPVLPHSASGPLSDGSLRSAVDGFERTYLKSVLAQCSERTEAARLLGISRQALHQKIVRYGL